MAVNRSWLVLSVLAFVGGLGGGWSGRAAAHIEAPHDDRATGARSAGAGAACVDAEAMQANGNLATEVHDYQQRFLAEERARHEAEARLAAKEAVLPEHLTVRSSEWSRLATEGRLRVRVPCASWESNGRSEVRGPGGGTASGAGRRFNARQRAQDAGLSEQEIDALPEIYERARRRTWGAISAACEASSDFRETVASLDVEPGDLDQRIRLCTGQVARVYEEATQRAIVRVAELRAEGASIDRAVGPEQRVLFGLSEASETLVSELVHTLGREKTTQALDYGVVCTDETVFLAHRR